MHFPSVLVPCALVCVHSILYLPSTDVSVCRDG